MSEPQNGNGMTAAEWRALVWSEVKALREEFADFRRDEFAPVRDAVLVKRAQTDLLSRIGRAVPWAALIGAVGALLGWRV